MSEKEEQEDEASVATEEKSRYQYDPKVRWVIPHRIDSLCYVGKDVIAIASDIYIMFLNMRTRVEHVYVANSREKGDGVDCVAGHKNNIFAFAEKVQNPRILIVMYPEFKIVSELSDPDVNRYKNVNMMENELVVGFSGFPDYLVAVWSWRTAQRLLSVRTGIVRRRVNYLASRSHMLVCACYGEGLVVWEVAPCFRRHFMMRRAKEEAHGWELSEPPLVSICWTNDGLLYAVDPDAKLYCVSSDAINMVTNLEWSDDELSGPNMPHISPLGNNGIIVFGPDENFRWLKKTGTKWRVARVEASPSGQDDPVERMMGNSTGDAAVAVTHAGRIYQLLAPAAADDDNLAINFIVYKQRNIKRIKFLAPNYDHVITLNDSGEVCIYEVKNAKLVVAGPIMGSEVSLQTSPVDALVAVFGTHGVNYGLALLTFETVPRPSLRRASSACLTHQQISRVVFSPTGRELVAAAMFAGHLFIYKVAKDYKLSLVRYVEIGRGLADCFLMKVGATMRAFGLVLFSDRYLIGERIVCFNAENGKDNKFAGKMAGPYRRLVPLKTRDTLLAIPHLSRQYHILKLSGEKGVTVQVKIGDIVDSGHELKCFSGILGQRKLVTFGADGFVVLRPPDDSTSYDFRFAASHRYESGMKYVAVDEDALCIAHLANNMAFGVTYMVTLHSIKEDICHQPVEPNSITEPIEIFNINDKNYLDLEEEKIVQQEKIDFALQREEVVRMFGVLRERLVTLLEENIAERPLHQLSLAEFNLHAENKKERLHQAEMEREEITLKTEARIRAQDKVTAWIKKYCWDIMHEQRVKIFAIFSHYEVENFPLLPSQRDIWPELQLTKALRVIEMENDANVFRPWLQPDEQSQVAMPKSVISKSKESILDAESKPSNLGQSQLTHDIEDIEEEDAQQGQPYVLSGTGTHNYINIPSFMIPQTLAYSFLQMNWLYEIVKLNVQNMRTWFNKQFDELMTLKKREVGLVKERNARLRFIIEELNKLSDLRGSFHHLIIQIKDPEWSQEEETERLIKVDPEECTIPPYISPSQIVIPPPDLGPKDDFRERALIEMMDGVLEKLWHEEIKKPIPKPFCMIEKDPEKWNEDDLRLVFDYEAKVKFRNEERDKYRKMLHAEYAKLSQVLNEGIVKFNMKVKEMWLTKLKVESVIGQENLNLMRLRRQNLDRLENAEQVEQMREKTKQYAEEVEHLTAELGLIQEQSLECQLAYDQLSGKDRLMERTFKAHFADLSPIINDQCYKFYKKRPKWHQRASMIPVVLYELATAIASNNSSYLVMQPPECHDYFKAVELLDQPSNMPTVMDENLWGAVCRLRRSKIEIEIRMRGVILETATVDSALATWGRAITARRTFLAHSPGALLAHRDTQHRVDINREIQLVLPAGQVEITTSGHIEDFKDAALVLREDIEKINNLILKVGAIKLRMMRRQMEFRKGILAKEWEHAQMKMKLRHMQQELYSYTRLKIPKELQWFLKNKERGYTDEQDYIRLEKEMAANKKTIERVLMESAQRCEDMEVMISKVTTASDKILKLIDHLNLKVSEKRINEDPLEPIRVRRVFKRRMETLVERSRLVRQVQANHSRIVLLQTELELLRLKTYPTLATFRTFC